MQNLIRDSLILGAQVNITITPAGYYPEENHDIPEPETGYVQHFDPDTGEQSQRDHTEVLEIGGVEFEYRFIDWFDGDMHTTAVPVTVWPAQLPFDKDNDNTWASSSLREWCNHDFYENIPDNWRQRIQPAVHHDVEDFVWIPSEAQVFGTAILSDRELEDGEIPLFRTKESRRLSDTRDHPRWWWTRSARSGYTNFVPSVNTDGSSGYDHARSADGAALPCFNLACKSE